MTAVRRNSQAGQPLMVLGGILFLWMAGRAALWESPFPDPAVMADLPKQLAENPTSQMGGFPDDLSDRKRVAQSSDDGPHQGEGFVVADNVWLSAREIRRSLLLPRHSVPLIAAKPVSPSGHRKRVSLKHLASQQLLWMAGMARIPAPPELVTLLEDASRKPPPVSTPTSPFATYTAKRWSLDSWLFLRQSGRASANILPGSGLVAPTYGASQAGAVFHYYLARSNRHVPRAYARISGPLATGSDGEIALGVSARPVPKIPIRAQLELRTRPNGQAGKLRPAALVVSEIPTIPLPVSARAEGYFQAGYVAGEDATGFAGGLVRVDREIADIDHARLRIGGGAWAGAQKGASRVDIGPSARLELRLGQQPARIDLDYRYRIAGTAEPKSGVALTISGSF